MELSVRAKPIPLPLLPSTALEEEMMETDNTGSLSLAEPQPRWGLCFRAQFTVTGGGGAEDGPEA